jgi:tetratricopeptide (TPR) repeat protein
MTGCNDRWNLENCTYFDITGGDLAAKVDIWLSHLQVYKLIKLCLKNIKIWLGIASPWFNQDAINPEKDNQLYHGAFRSREAQECFDRGNDYFYSGEYNAALKEFKQAEKLEPQSAAVHFRIACLYLQVFGNRELGMEQALSALSCGDSSILDYVFMLLYDPNPQARDKNNDLARRMRKIIQSSYQGESRLNAQKSLRLLCLFGNERREISRMLGYNLDRLIEIAGANNVRVILMDYPMPVWQIRDTLRKKASQHGIPLIDNYAVFEERLRQGSGKYDDLFAKDGHCNAAGYKLIAENVYQVIAEDRLIPRKE